MSKEAMKLALEALFTYEDDWVDDGLGGVHHNVLYDKNKVFKAIAALQEALAEQPEPIDTLITAWQALEETSGHVLDEGDVEGRMHMSVIRSAWEQMDSLVREMWDERGCK